MIYKMENNYSESSRIQKVLATLGLGSRRQIEKWIQNGHITVNGMIPTLGTKISLKDEVRLDGRKISLLQASVETKLLMYHKPVGEVCTRSDPEGRRTIYENLPKLSIGKWISVGRLDFNTSGLLLLTTNGELANELMHPRCEIEREYYVKVRGDVTIDKIKQLKKGIYVDGVKSFFKQVTLERRLPTNVWCKVVIASGKNQEVRKLFQSQQLQVVKLMRIRFGNYILPRDLAPGSYQEVAVNTGSI